MVSCVLQNNYLYLNIHIAIHSVLQYENNMEEYPSNHRAHLDKVCEIATRDLGSSLMYIEGTMSSSSIQVSGWLSLLN